MFGERAALRGEQHDLCDDARNHAVADRNIFQHRAASCDDAEITGRSRTAVAFKRAARLIDLDGYERILADEPCETAAAREMHDERFACERIGLGHDIGP